MEGDPDLVGLGDDMMIGQDQTAFGIDDDPRAQAAALLALIGDIKEMPKEGIAQQRVFRGLDTGYG